MTCSEFFQAKLQQLQDAVLPQLDDAVQQACTLERFTLAAASVRARLFPPFTNQEPCIALGTEMVRWQVHEST